MPPCHAAPIHQQYYSATLSQNNVTMSKRKQQRRPQASKKVRDQNRKARRQQFRARPKPPPPPPPPSLEPIPGGLEGVIIELSSGFCWVDLGERVLICRLRRSQEIEGVNEGYVNPITVGDQVIVTEHDVDEETMEGTVERVLPRRSVIARSDLQKPHLQQILVANVDQLLIVSSWKEPVIWFELIDRYLITTQRNALKAIICVNKIDLAVDRAQIDQAFQPYRALGCTIIYTSVLYNEGIETLREYLQSRTSVVSGLSGVGKSSLLAAVQPNLDIRIGDISEAHGEGKHTTTRAKMFKLEQGGFIVDTPGIRTFGLADLYRDELYEFYPDVTEAALRCRFKNCTHEQEPGCAIRASIEEGSLSVQRYHSYQKIWESLPEETWQAQWH